MKIKPVIKWSGSKRYQVEELIKYFPKKINTYYEPFLGSGVVMYRLMCGINHSINRFVGSDKNEDLIKVFNKIKDEPEDLYNKFLDMGEEYFYKIRDRYNKDHNPEDFFFITRTCFNGLIRYNSEGILNSSLHPNRKGIKPNKLRSIINEWGFRLNKYDVELMCRDYREIKPDKDDFIYADPPYLAVDRNNMYFRGFSHNKFFKWLKDLKCKYAFSFDGVSGEEDNTVDMSDELYDKHVYIDSKVSSYKRLSKGKKAKVKDSLYLSYEVSSDEKGSKG